MDGLQGLHSGLTVLFGIFVVWISWDFWEATVASVDDVVFLSILWGSFAIITILVIIGIPALISMKEDSQASIFSAALAFGAWWAGVLLMRLVRFIFGMFIDDFGNITPVLTDTLSVQIMTAFWLLIVIVFLYVFPIVIGAIPESVDLNSKMESLFGGGA